MFSKRSLGQNFLRSKITLWAIIKAADLRPGESVLEVGPGEGVLTEALLEAGAKVVAVEKDDRLYTALQTQFAFAKDLGRLTLVHADILDLADEKIKRLVDEKYKLVANIPYNITGELLRKFLGGDAQPTEIVLMLQKEVAQRIVAKDDKESILSLSVKAFGEPKYVKTVPRGAFSPVPNVDSAILKITNISRSNFPTAEDEEGFFDLVRRGFAHKRKLLKSNLNCPAAVLAAAKLSENIRAEDLKLESWFSLTRLI